MIKNLITLSLFALIANLSFAQKIYGVLYVRDGNESLDTASMKDLNAMVARLNFYRQSDADYKYKVVSIGTFTLATQYNLDRTAREGIGLDEIAATVCHGAYRDINGDGKSSPDEYLGTVLDTADDMPGDGWPVDQVAPDLATPQYCSADGKVNVNDIGAKLAASQGGKYPMPSAPSTSGTSSSSGGTSAVSGGSTNFGGAVSTSTITMEFDYGYLGSNGIYYVVFSTISLTITNLNAINPNIRILAR